MEHLEQTTMSEAPRGERATTIPKGSRAERSEAQSARQGDDIVSTCAGAQAAKAVTV